MSKSKMEIKVICGLGGNSSTTYKIRENNGKVSFNTLCDWISNNDSLIKDATSFSIKVSIDKNNYILVLKDTECKKPYDFVQSEYIIKRWFDNKFYANSRLVDTEVSTSTFTTFAYRLNNLKS